jgi:hypothetical protein
MDHREGSSWLRAVFISLACLLTRSISSMLNISPLRSQMPGKAPFFSNCLKFFNSYPCKGFHAMETRGEMFWFSGNAPTLRLFLLSRLHGV